MRTNTAILHSIEERLSRLEQMIKEGIESPIPAKELEERLCISRQQHIRLRKKGILKGYRLGGKLYFLMSEVRKAMREDRDSQK